MPGPVIQWAPSLPHSECLSISMMPLERTVGLRPSWLAAWGRLDHESDPLLGDSRAKPPRKEGREGFSRGKSLCKGLGAEDVGSNLPSTSVLVSLCKVCFSFGRMGTMPPTSGALCIQDVKGSEDGSLEPPLCSWLPATRHRELCWYWLFLIAMR